MPTATESTKSVNKPKKDYKLELLEQIQKKYGLVSAVAMDEAFKNEKRQIKELMINGNLGVEDIAQSKNVDLNSIGEFSKNQEQTEVSELQPQPKMQQQPQGIISKPASSPLGFGGMSIQDGQMVEQKPGFIAGLLSTLLTANPRIAASMDLNRLNTVADIQQKQQMGGMKELQNLMSQERLNLSQERLELERGMENRRVKAEGRRVLQDTKNTIYNSGAELTEEDLQDPDIAKIVEPLIKQNNIEPIIDPDSGLTIYSVPPKGVLDKTRKEVAGINLKRKELAKELSDYFAVGDSLPTADGLGRFTQGAELYAGSVFQTDKQGAMAAQLKGLNKRLRVKLVRAAGDVGNLNIVEQDAAERLLYNFSDSTDLRTLKRSFLKDLSRALDNESELEIKRVVSKWMKQEGQPQGQTQDQQGLAPDKKKRLEELRRKKAEGTLGR